MPHYGFNFQWMYDYDGRQLPLPPDERALDFLAYFGFNFVRIPLDYRFWTRDFDYFQPDQRVWEMIDRYLAACQARGLHLSLALHRAPGYCHRRPELERDNLWQDAAVQAAFVFLWRGFAERYRHVSAEDLSFNLLSEPPKNGELGFSPSGYADLVRRTVAAIREVDPTRGMVVDGWAYGREPIPALAELDVVQGGRGFQPMALTHFGAPWRPDLADLPRPTYPSEASAALRAEYTRWHSAEMAGVPVHIGALGCYNGIRNKDALRWFGDLLTLYHEWGWGYALWEFDGPFGIVGHGRVGANYYCLRDYYVDTDLLALLIENQVSA